MKARDTFKTATLRYILAQIKNKEVDERRELTDEDVVQIIRKEVKALDEAAHSFRTGGREDLAGENDAQCVILKAYLPAELSDADLQAKIHEIIAEHQEMYQKNPAALIGICVSRLKSHADPSRISRCVRERQS